MRPSIPLLSVSGYRALVQQFWFDQLGAARHIILVCIECYNWCWTECFVAMQDREMSVSDHYPIQFQIDTNAVPEGTWLTRKRVFFYAWETILFFWSSFWLHFTALCRAMVQSPPDTGSDCTDCFSRALSNGTFPSGTFTSVEALNISANSIGRYDPGFLKYSNIILLNACLHWCFFSFVNLEGAPFIFSDEERQADWCGRNGRTCGDCRGVTGSVSIIDQCSDRIMCPNMALKLIELLNKLQNCTDITSKLNSI